MSPFKTELIILLKETNEVSSEMTIHWEGTKPIGTGNGPKSPLQKPACRNRAANIRCSVVASHLVASPVIVMASHLP